MSPLDLDAIESRAKRCASDVPLPECECEKRGHAPCCYDCYLAYQAAVGPTFEACGRGDVLALVALARAQAAEIATLRVAYTQDLDGLRAELRRADDGRATWRDLRDAVRKYLDAETARAASHERRMSVAHEPDSTPDSIRAAERAHWVVADAAVAARTRLAALVGGAR